MSGGLCPVTEWVVKSIYTGGKCTPSASRRPSSWLLVHLPCYLSVQSLCPQDVIDVGWNYILVEWPGNCKTGGGDGCTPRWRYRQCIIIRVSMAWLRLVNVCSETNSKVYARIYLDIYNSRYLLGVPHHNFGLCPPSVAPSHDHES